MKTAGKILSPTSNRALAVAANLSVLIAAAVLCCSSLALAVEKSKDTKKLSTNVNFGDLLVDGKYRYSTEALTTVENEKGLDDLLGVRLNFKDRLQRSIERR